MDDIQKRKTLLQKNTNDFNTMRQMLSDIEINIMQVDPLKQFEFYQPIQNMILEVWHDSRNKNDTFLFPKK